MVEKGDINNMVNIIKKLNRENYLKMIMIQNFKSMLVLIFSSIYMFYSIIYMFYIIFRFLKWIFKELMILVLIISV